MIKTFTLTDGTVVSFDITHEWKSLKVIEMKLPVNGCVTEWNKESGEYRVFINSEMSEQEKLKTFIHEMIHLYRGDFEKEGGDVQEIESECHKLTNDYINKYL